MKNIKGILIGAVTVPVLVLTGGLAYASTATPSHPAPARAVATVTARHPVGQMRLNWYDWRYTGHWCNRHGHSYGLQRQPAHQRSHRHPGYRHHHGYQHRGYRNWANQGYQGGGYQGGWGNSGSGKHGSGWGNGGCCRHGW
jgi:hypothetical protein